MEEKEKTVKTKVPDKGIDAERFARSIERHYSAFKYAISRIEDMPWTPPKINIIPYIPMLHENNSRKGFFEHGEFIALRDALPQYLKLFVTFGYNTGWRHSEIANLKWSQVDLVNGIVRLEVGETKNDEARTFYLDEELKEKFQDLYESRKTGGYISPFVFLNHTGTDRIKRFDKAWKKACRDAGIGVRLFHDFRRTAVRNMVRAGVPERVAMMVSGHKTRSVFDRYNIVDDKDLVTATKSLTEYLSKQTGKVSGKVHQFNTAIKNRNLP